MPDRERKSISASQTPALFNQSPYFTRWMLWHHFKNGLSIEGRENERMDWGKALQDDILTATAQHFGLDIWANLNDDYTRIDRLGATIDGKMHAPDRGTILVEAKNIDWLRWRDTWTETAAAQHVEIQLQTQLHVENRFPGTGDCDFGVIAALIGGNDLRFLERDRNVELGRMLEHEAGEFFVSLDKDQEPDAFGSALELPMLAQLYPSVTPVKVFEDLEDEDLALALRQFDWARAEESFAKKLKEAALARILDKAGDAAIVRGNGSTAYIKRPAVRAQICEPHAEPKILKKAGTQNRIEIVKTEPVEPLSVPDFRAARLFGA